MSKTRTLNPYDMESRIHDLEENGGGGGGSTDSAKRSDIASEFSVETSYTAGTYVYYEDTLYIFNVDHSAGEWDATDVAVANVTDEITSNKAAIDALDTAVSGKSTVTANPEGTATGNLSSIGINGTKYAVGSGTVYLEHGQIGQADPDEYIENCPLDHNLVAGQHIVITIFDDTRIYTLVTYYPGGHVEFDVGGFDLDVYADHVGLPSYSGSFRDIYCFIKGLWE